MSPKSQQCTCHNILVIPSSQKISHTTWARYISILYGLVGLMYPQILHCPLLHWLWGNHIRLVAGKTLQWRHNGRDDVSNHQARDCLLNRLFRHISGTDQRKHQSSASLAFVRGIHRVPVNSSHKGPVTRKMFPYGNRQYAVECRYNAVHYNTILYISLPWLEQIINHILNLQKTHHNSA